MTIKIKSIYESYTAQELIDLHRKYSFQLGIRVHAPYTKQDEEWNEIVEQVEKELLRRLINEES